MFFSNAFSSVDVPSYAFPRQSAFLHLFFLSRDVKKVQDVKRGKALIKAKAFITVLCLLLKLNKEVETRHKPSFFLSNRFTNAVLNLS